PLPLPCSRLRRRSDAGRCTLARPLSWRDRRILTSGSPGLRAPRLGKNLQKSECLPFQPLSNRGPQCRTASSPPGLACQSQCAEFLPLSTSVSYVLFSEPSVKWLLVDRRFRKQPVKVFN